MTVQKRYQRRLPLNRDIELIYNKRSLSGKAKNLSAEGMGLQVEALSIPKGMLLEVDLHIEGGHWQIPAVVVHSTATRLGVMFLTRQDLLYATLLTSDERETTHLPYWLMAPYSRVNATRD